MAKSSLRRRRAVSMWQEHVEELKAEMAGEEEAGGVSLQEE